ncbi:hypothetical protein evm_006329 [Chilo suppressalis]|nr:hypothetical protein evm_006329 [Chilo suppressalis]
MLHTTKMFFKATTFLLVIFVACRAAPTSDTDLEALVDQIFGPTSSTNEPPSSSTGAAATSKLDGIEDGPTSDTDSEALVDHIFGPTSSTTEPPSSSTGAATTSKFDGIEDGTECTTNGEKGVCVAYYRCEEPASEPNSAIDIAFSEATCPSYLQLCCLSKNVDQPSTTPTELH